MPVRNLQTSYDAVNRFCLENHLDLTTNPAISPDACLNWQSMATKLRATGGIPRGESGLTIHEASRVTTACGLWMLVSDETGDRAWLLEPTGSAPPSKESIHIGTRVAYPATWAHLLMMKNLIQEYDATSTVFPTAAHSLQRTSLGVGARFTTLHWPAVEWSMVALGLSLTANQNSIPRELVYDVNAMLEGTLDRVPFPFIGASVPEGHQGQSVEGMSHLGVLSKLTTGFHHHRIPWGFNADHQPVGGVFDRREPDLVRGCILASYITFDLSPELSITPQKNPSDARSWCDRVVGGNRLKRIHDRIRTAGTPMNSEDMAILLARVWPALIKMHHRDRLYRDARTQAFSTNIGRAYVRELSIDELPGITSPETISVLLAACEVLDMPVQFLAPAFGFQKNHPYENNRELERLVTAAWTVCKEFGVSIGFHSGSGKSLENYRLCGRITKGCLEIKTSGRYTYEMGVALACSSDPNDRQLWLDWWTFTRDLSLAGCFSEDQTERASARTFVRESLVFAGRDPPVFENPYQIKHILSTLKPDPNHMFWFEYNFLFILAGGGSADKRALGDHTARGYRQRSRFYRISDEGRLRYAVGVASYVITLAEMTGMVAPDRCQAARSQLASFTSYRSLVADINPKSN